VKVFVGAVQAGTLLPSPMDKVPAPARRQVSEVYASPFDWYLKAPVLLLSVVVVDTGR
jgi:hypothetical protein